MLFPHPLDHRSIFLLYVLENCPCSINIKRGYRQVKEQQQSFHDAVRYFNWIEYSDSSKD